MIGTLRHCPKLLLANRSELSFLQLLMAGDRKRVFLGYLVCGMLWRLFNTAQHSGLIHWQSFPQLSTLFYALSEVLRCAWLWRSCKIHSAQQRIIADVTAPKLLRSTSSNSPLSDETWRFVFQFSVQSEARFVKPTTHGNNSSSVSFSAHCSKHVYYQTTAALTVM